MTRSIRLRSRHSKSSRGQSLVEMALLLPIFIFLLLIAIDFGRVFFTYVAITNAAREGAVYAAARPTDTAGTIARAQGEMGSGGASTTVTKVCSPSCASSTGVTLAGTNKVTVTVSTTFQFITPFIDSGFGTLWTGFPGTGLVISKDSTAVIP